MDRRGFLGSMLAACAAPAIVRASSLMKCSGIIVPSQELLIAPWTVLTPAIIAREALLVLEKHLAFTGAFNRDYIEALDKYSSFKNNTIMIRRPSLAFSNG